MYFDVESPPVIVVGVMPQDLWIFSCKVYDDDAVSSVCLALQDECGLDVNCVLACVWFGWSGRGRLSDADVEAMVSQSQVWGDCVVRPLRGVRRWLKPQSGDAAIGPFRDQVKALELEAERYLQTRIEVVLVASTSAGGRGGDVAACARANLFAYAENIDRDWSSQLELSDSGRIGDVRRRRADLFDHLLAAIFSP